MQDINQKAIADLAKLLKDNRLSEIEYESGDTRIRVVADFAGAVPMAIPTAVAAPAAVEAAPAKENLENAVKSPMVGIVYLASDPNSPAFVNVGDKVGPGQTLCLIEAMKTFNPVKAVKAGTVKKILVESGSPVEFNEPLFIVE